MSINTPHVPKILGIINLTNDSFSDGGDYNSVSAGLARAEQMLRAGVDALDLGGESTRPGSVEVETAEELNRVIPVLESIMAKFPHATISIDTRKSEVAKATLQAGATIINDVSMLTFDPELAATIAQFPHAKIVIGHSRGTPENMNELAQYQDVVEEVKSELSLAVEQAKFCGVKAENIILDIGLGFAKTSEHNIALLNNLPSIKMLGYPVMIGHSRKRFIGEICGVADAKERDKATLALSCALSRQIDWVRVHDATSHAEAFKLLGKLR